MSNARIRYFVAGPFMFRAWHPGPPSGTMLYEKYPGEVFKWLHEGQPITIMQFTGKYDRNRMALYGGDIIESVIDGERYVGVIEYNDWSSAFVVSYKNLEEKELHPYLDTMIDKYGVTKIGDFFQNPELLPSEDTK
jgi:hypothetical protein